MGEAQELTENPHENKEILAQKQAELLRTLSERRKDIQRIQESSGPTAIRSDKVK